MTTYIKSDITRILQSRMDNNKDTNDSSRGQSSVQKRGTARRSLEVLTVDNGATGGDRNADLTRGGSVRNPSESPLSGAHGSSGSESRKQQLESVTSNTEALNLLADQLQNTTVQPIKLQDQDVMERIDSLHVTRGEAKTLRETHPKQDKGEEDFQDIHPGVTCQVKCRTITEIDKKTEMEVIKILNKDLPLILSKATHGRVPRIRPGCIQLDISLADENDLANMNTLYDSGKLKDILLEAFNTQAVRDVIGVEEVDIVVERPVIVHDDPPPDLLHDCESISYTYCEVLKAWFWSPDRIQWISCATDRVLHGRLAGLTPTKRHRELIKKLREKCPPHPNPGGENCVICNLFVKEQRKRPHQERLDAGSRWEQEIFEAVCEGKPTCVFENLVKQNPRRVDKMLDKNGWSILHNISLHRPSRSFLRAIFRHCDFSSLIKARISPHEQSRFSNCSAYEIADMLNNTKLLREYDRLIEQGEAETDLMKAVRTQDKQRISELLASQIQVDEQCEDKYNSWKYSALNVACEVGNMDIVDLLIKAKADPQKAHSHASLLHAAAISGNDHLLQYLVEKSSQDINFKATWKCRIYSTPLEAAATLGHFNTVKKLIQMGATVTAGVYPCATASGNMELLKYLEEEHSALTNTECKPITENTTLECACIGGYIDMVYYLLLHHHMDPNEGSYGDYLDRTPIEIAACFGHTGIIKLLLEFGARVTESVLSCAAKFGHTPVIQYLLGDDVKRMSINVDINSLDHYGYSALCRVCEYGRTSTVKYLLETGASPNIRCKDSSPLEICANNGNLVLVKELINHGAEVTNNVLVDAAGKGHMLVMKYLLGDEVRHLGINIDGLDENGHSALYKACISSQLPVVKFLIEEGASLNISSTGDTCLHTAIKSGNKEIVSFILDLELAPQLFQKKNYFCKDRLLYLVRGKDTGNPVWLYVLVHRRLLPKFLKMTQGGNLDVADFGRVILSGKGSEPPDAVIAQINKDYNGNLDPESPDQLPLHMAVCRDKDDINIDVIDNLLNIKGASSMINVGDHFNLSPLDIAAAFGNRKVVELLLDHGAENIESAISCAADNDLNGDHKVVIDLLETRLKCSDGELEKTNCYPTTGAGGLGHPKKHTERSQKHSAELHQKQATPKRSLSKKEKESANSSLQSAFSKRIDVETKIPATSVTIFVACVYN